MSKIAYAITMIMPQTKNYTPSSILFQWAKENNAKYISGAYGENKLKINNCIYVYNSWRIEKHSDGTETVYIYLEKK